MATVDGLSKARMLQIEGQSIVAARLSGDNLILTNYKGEDIPVGSVRGPQGQPGQPGSPGTVTSVNGKTGASITLTASDLSIVAATTSASGLVELATTAETQTGTDTSRAVTPAGLAATTATATRAGLIAIATASEVAGRSDNSKAVTASGLTNHPGLPFAIAAGTANVPGNLSSGTTADVSVTLPSGRFTQPPLIIVQSGTVRLVTQVDPSTTTATGFTFRAGNFSGGGQTAASVATWIAIQRLSSGGAG